MVSAAAFSLRHRVNRPSGKITEKRRFPAVILYFFVHFSPRAGPFTYVIIKSKTNRVFYAGFSRF